MAGARAPRIVLTSFATWRDDQPSNASDDLLEWWVERHAEVGDRVQLVRQLPVHTERASDRVIAAIERDRPDYVLCCGMAESRTDLELETNAKCDDEVLHSTADLALWVRGLTRTRLSHDAGSFVCNGTYYRVLQWLRDRRYATQCVFVHVPRLDGMHQSAVKEDFSEMIQRLLAS